MWKIAFGVAFGLIMAGIAFMFFTGFTLWGVSKTIEEQNQQALQRFQQSIKHEPLPVVPIAIAPPENRQSPGMIQAPQMYQIPKSKEQLVKEKSSQAYVKVRKDVEDFKAQYKKPPECYDMKDNATRIHCANAFIQARKAFEASNK